MSTSSIQSGAAKLLAALGEESAGSEHWRLSVYDRSGDRVSLSASYEGAPGSYGSALPGGCGIRAELEGWGTTWHVRPASSTLTKEQGVFWTALSERQPPQSAFNGFTIETRELLSFLPERQTGELLEGLRTKATFRERRLFENAGDAKALRSLVEGVEASYACPIKIGEREYASEDGTLRVRYSVAAASEYTPARAWLVLQDRFGRERLAGEYPQWWPTRRAADDEARRLLNRP
jgi:hypothetical protein